MLYLLRVRVGAETDFSVAENVADWDDMENPRSTHGRDPADTLPGNELLHRLLEAHARSVDPVFDTVNHRGVPKFDPLRGKAVAILAGQALFGGAEG